MSEIEIKISILIEAMTAVMIRDYGYTYQDALRIVLASNTFKRITNGDWIVEEGPNYVSALMLEEYQASQASK